MDIKFIRKITGFSQSEVAQAAGFSRGKLSLAERGYARLSDDEKEKIANFFQIDVERIDWPKP